MNIKQIQEENRRYILEANFGSFEEVLKDDSLSCEVKGNYNSLALTLSRVLLALKSQEIGFLDGYLFELEDKGYDGMMERWICKWDLKKETLEEQEESTQLAVNKLLTT